MNEIRLKLKKLYNFISISRHIKVFYYFLFRVKCMSCGKVKLLNKFSVITEYFLALCLIYVGVYIFLINSSYREYLEPIAYYLISNCGGYIVLLSFIEMLEGLFNDKGIINKLLDFIFMIAFPLVFLFLLSGVKFIESPALVNFVKVILSQSDWDKFVIFFKDNWLDIIMPNWWGIPLVYFLFHYRSFSTFKKLERKEKLAYIKYYKKLNNIKDLISGKETK